MDYVTAKSNQATAAATAAAAELLNSTRATIDEYSKELAKNPDKTRALLNLLFVPTFKPTFVPDLPTETGNLDDVELLGPDGSKPLRYPLRMFDLETGNLVEYPEIGILGQYCILSHSWKGSEVDYGYIWRARSEAPAALDSQTAREDDVTLITRLAKSDVEKQARKIEKLAANVIGEIGLKATDSVVTELLKRRKTSTWLLDELNSARKEEEKARAKMKFRELDANAFRDLTRTIEEKVSSNPSMNPGRGPEAADSTTTRAASETSCSHVPTTSGKVEKAQAAYDDTEAQKDAVFFQKHVLLREAVDGMVGCLQRWKSTTKIRQSIERARAIFDDNMFPTGGKRYLWNDTCCINKQQPAELVESLGIMGEWYAYAEFCLVHLDTRRLPQFCRDHNDKRCTVEGCQIYENRKQSADEWIDEWDLFSDKQREPNITRFDEIRDYVPEWAERGWTLQELVLSRNTFYVNSAWKPLARPVENLGPYYYICPFIEQYCSCNEWRAPQGFWNLETLEMILEASNTTHASTDQDDKSLSKDQCLTSETTGDDVRRVQVAKHLIAILEELGVKINRSIDMETAVSWVTQAVYIASVGLTNAHGHSHGGNKSLLSAVEEHMGKYAPGNSTEVATPSETDRARHIINFLLACLVAEAVPLILKDRQYIASFGHVQSLDGWGQGTSRKQFPADKVMALACKRKCTVKTDSAYSLMGLADVRFPTYSAEGLPKAISRLLDEILIAYNDVSVFNWSGIARGSSIRGRSLYPSNLKAYAPEESSSADADRNKELAQKVQFRMHEVMAAYHNVFRMLRDAIDFIKKREQKHLPVEWVQGIIVFVQKAQYPSLSKEMHSVGKILTFIQKHCGNPTPEAAHADGRNTPGPTGDLKGSSYIPSMPTMPSLPSLPSMPSISSGFRPTLPTTSSLSKGMMSLPSLGGKQSSQAATVTPSPPAKKGIMGMRSSFASGFGKWDSKSTATQPDPVTPLSPASSTAEAIVEEPQAPAPTPQEAPSKPSAPVDEVSKVAWEPLHVQVMSYINSITPQDGDDSSDNEDEGGSKQRRGTSLESLASLASPKSPTSPVLSHPEFPLKRAATLPKEVEDIVAGIDTPDFDARRRADPATISTSTGSDTVSPYPLIVNNSGIEGIFDIQRVIITFRDPDKLRARVRRATAGPHHRVTGWCTISTGFAMVMVKFACERRLLERQLDVAQAVETKVLREGRRPPGMRRTNSMFGETGPAAAAGGGEAEEEDDGSAEAADLDSPLGPHTEEEQLVSRMIQFVQEPSLEAVAGEWVLARASGAPGAHWFLCALELGAPSAGSGGAHALYGRRIAADAIDFAAATPETGLLSVWSTYMARKKRKMCKILRMYVDARAMAGSGAEAMRQARRALEAAGDETEGGGHSGGGGGVAGGASGGVSGVLDQVLFRGKTAAKLVGQYTVMAALEKMFEMRADHLDKTLSASVLKRTPKELQAAVESLNDNQDLLPAMFHSSRRVHMF